MIAVAAAAAIIGDNIGCDPAPGRTLAAGASRTVSLRRRQVLIIGEPFFARARTEGRVLRPLDPAAAHLGVLVGRGDDRRWRSFALWNALGGLGWAITIGLLAYFLSNSVKNVISNLGLFGLVGVLLAGLGVLLTSSASPLRRLDGGSGRRLRWRGHATRRRAFGRSRALDADRRADGSGRGEAAQAGVEQPVGDDPRHERGGAGVHGRPHTGGADGARSAPARRLRPPPPVAGPCAGPRALPCGRTRSGAGSGPRPPGTEPRTPRRRSAASW